MYIQRRFQNFSGDQLAAGLSNYIYISLSIWQPITQSQRWISQKITSKAGLQSFNANTPEEDQIFA